MDKPPNVIVFETPEQLAETAAQRFVECAAKVDGEVGRFSVALAGGRTPKRVYELLATETFSNRINWLQVHLFFGDERSVPPTHPDSNYAMVNEALLSKIAIPAGNVHRITGEDEPPKSATTYETELKTFFAGRDWPRFDLVLLGMGEDGHTASLFPHSEALTEKSRWVVATKYEQTGQNRITLTLPVINHAAQVVFLVNGNEKAQRLAEVLRPQPGSEMLPAQAVKPVDGSLEWFVDAAAAACL
ncbi:MAG TPA: 6-phosphogluconolactonase [Pyrinomonadaceae bacterium]|jgi:6-phosphogluconolactonase